MTQCSPTGIIDFCGLELSGVLGIQSLRLPYISEISDALHPGTMCAVMAPLMALYSFPLGRRIWTSYILSDTLNFQLKCLARADRPYWVSTSVEQFAHTCESGYGFPSGHCMVTLAVFLSLPKNVVPFQNIICGVLILILAVARVATGTHFPSQTIVGILLGVLVSMVVGRVSTWHLAALLVSIPVLYFGNIAAGVDQLDSFELQSRDAKILKA
eukprot:GEMP01040390.1.p1 GENE.GEMP01040390.1~~GEMP01040390.1.p1  ORF type:complete len:214 (+),score=31.69 GEMP01040390.1:127-768(+)